MDTLHRLDDHLLLEINNFSRSTGWLHTLVASYAKYGVVLFAVLLLAGVTLARGRSARTLAAAGWACIATLVAVAVNQPVGHLAHEARPYVTHPHLLVLASRTSDFSFPSDHAVMAGAVAGGLLLVSWRLGLVAVVAALLMAFSRVYIAAHYPWDVAAGLALGAAVAVLGWLALGGPLAALTAWLRAQRGVRAVFTERTGAVPAAPTALTAPTAPSTSGAPAALRR
jgi:membrane-associated phospholipid phosphatase